MSTRRTARTSADRRRMLTEGPILEVLVKLSLPVVLANTLQALYQLVDTFWVGRIGDVAVAAVSVSLPIWFTLTAAAGGLAVVGTTFVAQYTGARNQEMVTHTVGQIHILVLVASAVVAAGGFVAADPILRLMGVEAELFGPAGDYMRITFIGIVFQFLYFVFQSVLRGIGEVRFPLYVVTLTVILNCILDPILIFGWGPFPAMGVAGAALATIFTQGVSAAIGIIALTLGWFDITIRWRDLRPDWPFLKRAIAIGLPASLEQSMRGLSMTAMTFLVAIFGTSTLAVYGVGTRIFSFIVIPGIGLGAATAALVGQCVGAGKVERAKEAARKSAQLSFWFATAIGVLVFIFAPEIVAFFVPGEEQVIREGAYMVRLNAFFFGTLSAQQALAGAFRGAGDTMGAMLLTLIAVWVVRVPLAFVLSRFTDLGADGLWFAFPATNLFGFLFACLWFLKRRWWEKTVTETERRVEETREELTAERGTE